MQYRELGRTGLRVSEIGLGCEGFAGRDEAFTREMFRLTFAQGVNCMDLYSPDPELRSRIGRMLRGKREQFIMQAHLCTIWKNGQYQCCLLYTSYPQGGWVPAFLQSRRGAGGIFRDAVLEKSASACHPTALDQSGDRQPACFGARYGTDRV